MKTGAKWYAYDPQAVAAETIGANDGERLRFFDTMQKGLLLQRRGLNSCADSMLEERDAFFAKSSEGGRKGMARRWGHKPLITPLQGPNKAPITTDTDTDKYTDRYPDTITSGFAIRVAAYAPENDDGYSGEACGATGAGGNAEGVGSVGQSLKGEGANGGENGDGGATDKDPFPDAKANPAMDAFRKSKCKGRMLRNARAESVIGCMIDFCGESNPRAAASGYRNELRRLGADNFKEVCAQFADGLESGADPEPGNRGAALMARLRDCAPGIGAATLKRGGVAVEVESRRF